MTEPPNGDIGAWLRAARERSGLSLRQIADSTKLSVRTLDLLERNRVSQLPGGIYRRAIVRSYASEIGLDPETTLRTFLARYPQDDDTAIPKIAPAPAPRPRSKVLRLATSVVGALIPVVAGLFYFSLNTRGSVRSGGASQAAPK
jgi:cytoskeletal protein RodZ